jgi:type II secretory pathway pseudopilin PulG
MRRKDDLLAFTLIETMVAVSLLVIVLVTVGPTFRKSSVSTKGAELSLAAALTEARQNAISQQIPVALVIPSGNGSQGQADSYYIASGKQPDLRFMVGHWPLDTSKLRDSTLTTTVKPPPEAVWENDVNVNLWGLPAARDCAFIFTPRGKLISNGLPSLRWGLPHHRFPRGRFHGRQPSEHIRHHEPAHFVQPYRGRLSLHC